MNVLLTVVPKMSPDSKLLLSSAAFALSINDLGSFCVRQGVDTMTAKLTNSLRAPHVTVRQAADAIKHLLHLHAEGARSVQHLDPIKLYLEAQVSTLESILYST